jgi:hypothetical protein
MGLIRLHPKFLDSQVAMQNEESPILGKIRGVQRHSEERKRLLLELLDVRARSFLPIVSDLQYQEVYAVLLEDFCRHAVSDYSEFDIGLLQWMKDPIITEIQQRGSHWMGEGFRQLQGLQQKPAETDAPTRRGYRKEVKDWMLRTGIETQEHAARRLAVSIDVLKSIMSDKGEPRYSAATLAIVLEKIGCKPQGGE